MKLTPEEINKLEGAALNAEVARLQGEEVEIIKGYARHPRGLHPYIYDYDTNYGATGFILEQEKISVVLTVANEWVARVQRCATSIDHPSYGPTALVAILRAYVMSEHYPSEVLP